MNDGQGNKPRRFLRAGGEVDACSVALRFFGDDLDPGAITETLGASPDSACRKGDITHGKRGDRVEPRGKWVLRIEQRGAPLEALINQLLDRLSDDPGVWRDLAEYSPDLFCGLYLERWNRGCCFSATTLKRLAERGLELGLDIYFTEGGDPA